MAWEKDLLERKKVAIFLQDLLESDDDIKVVNIDSAWGTGKTFFLKNWSEELGSNRGVVYFNAWKRDYTGDPFISLVSSIKSQLEAQAGLESKVKRKFEEFSEKASSAVVSAAPVVLKEVAKGVARKFSGVDADKISEAIEKAGEDEDGGGVLESVSDSAKDAADNAAVQVVKSLIDSNEKSVESVESFRKVFEELVDEVGRELNEDGSEAPVYVFVDELDRCRPTYAIELLERVKHFLDVPGCKFVIATDTKQLCHSIKAVYGSGFNSFGYLKRFFDITYSLDNSDLRSWVKSKVFFDSQVQLSCLKTRVNPKGVGQGVRFPNHPDPVSPDGRTIVSGGVELDEVQVVIISLIKTFSVSLRDLDKIMMHIKASLLGFCKDVDFIFLAYLVFLKNIDPDIYKNFLDGSDVRGRLKTAYPSFKLYMVYECVDLHDVAEEYLRVSNMNTDQIMEELNSSDGKYSYTHEIRMRAFNGERYSEYVKPVELAGQIS
ncbi:KAP family P-loop NTPase fold protein [Halomonas litopenaei]|uniref:KAP family P-loop NTPase fold protein n=1 Tax=Halomonas litopenaei TaxID=2109328 RepID=UPI003FA0CC92